MLDPTANESATPAVALPLQGLRVLDLGRFVAAPWCTQMLGDLGAEVIKIERPGAGDQMRQYGPPFLQDEHGQNTTESAYFLCTNRSKQSVTIDIASPDGQALVRQLASRSDILVENYKVGDLTRFGLDYTGICAVRPDIVYCSITAFGQTGPYAQRPGLDSVFQAMGGLMSVTGMPDGPPQKVGVTIIDIITGLYATAAILAAVRHRDRTGHGQHIDLALLDVAIATMSHRAQDYLLTGEVPQRTGTATTGSAPAQVFRCQDGEINIQSGDQPAFEALCEVLDLRSLALDPRFRTRADRWRHRSDLLPPIEAAIANWRQRDLYDALVARSVVAAPIYTLDQTFSDPQVIHRGMRSQVPHPLTGALPLLRNPIRFSHTPMDIDRAPPLLGQHTIEVLTGLLGMSSAAIEELAQRQVIGEVSPQSTL
jgi:crotonobetainyl-CoA:carnitine CoA-transferase CaiB-like acyl-CoA transferase